MSEPDKVRWLLRAAMPNGYSYAYRDGKIAEFTSEARAWDWRHEQVALSDHDYWTLILARPVARVPYRRGEAR